MSKKKKSNFSKLLLTGLSIGAAGFASYYLSKTEEEPEAEEKPTPIKSRKSAGEPVKSRKVIDFLINFHSDGIQADGKLSVPLSMETKAGKIFMDRISFHPHGLSCKIIDGLEIMVPYNSILNVKPVTSKKASNG